MQYHAEPHRSAPEQWETISYTIRRPGCAAWATGIAKYDEARQAKRDANDVNDGHVIYAEQTYIGDIESLRGTTRSVERG